MDPEALTPTRAHPLDNRFPPPLVLAVVGAAMWFASRFAPALALPAELRFGLGGALGVAGLAAAALGVAAFRKARTTIDPTRPANASLVVDGGIYRVTRNPMYLGMTLALSALAVLLAAPWTLIGPVAFAAFVRRFQILPEERALSGKFGSAYETYRKRTRRWL